MIQEMEELKKWDDQKVDELIEQTRRALSLE